MTLTQYHSRGNDGNRDAIIKKAGLRRFACNDGERHMFMQECEKVKYDLDSRLRGNDKV
jgi:hypothetical protein